MTRTDDKPLTRNIRPGQEPLDLAGYERAGGYQGLRKALKMPPAEIADWVSRANLRGRGGAGFPTGKKWSFLPPRDADAGPRYLVVNADEMEPGTMKDRLLMEGDPHQLIEGIIVSSFAVGAQEAYIFLRAEYHLAARRLRAAIAEAYDKRYLGPDILNSGYNLELHLHTSAGRYMCGEETGLLNALEGRRAIPRSKPPYPQVSGLWGRPTVVNNVETICCVHHIINRGWEWFGKLSLSRDGGTKIYGVSGRVNRPGLWELPLGTPLREIIEGHAGGMKSGFAMRGVIPGGASTNFMLSEHLDVKMDYAGPETVGSRLGTGTMIVLDDKSCPVGMLLSMEAFFARESCGWCTPCREGLPWVARTLEALEQGRGQKGDLEVLDEHVKWIQMGHTFCALAPGAMEPLRGAMQYFRDDFQRHIDGGCCPLKGPRSAGATQSSLRLSTGQKSEIRNSKSETNSKSE